MKNSLLIFAVLLYCTHAHTQTLGASRSVNWQLFNAGECPHPDRVINFIDAGGNADGTASNDLLIQSLLADIEDEKVMIWFPPGTYNFNEPVDLVDNVILRGAGNSSVLQFDLGGEKDIISIKGGESATITSITVNCSKDSSRIKVSSTASFSVGNYIKIYDDDATLITSSWALHTTGQINKIINISGGYIYLESPLRRNYTVAKTPKVVKLNIIKNVWLENFKIVRLDETEKQTSNIYFKNAVQCVVQGIESYNCNYAHIEIHSSTDIEVSGCYMQDAMDYGDGGKAYGVVLHYTTGECLIHDNIFNHLRHSMLLQAGANGNVVAYNYSTDPYWTGVFLPSDAAGDLVLHGNYPYANLLEGNIVENIVIDDSHGKNGPYNTFFRNRAENYGLVMSSASAGNDQNYIGNEITNTTALKGLYNLSGTGHFEYGNNVKGTIKPAGTSLLPEPTLYFDGVSLFYETESAWPPIGTPNSINEYAISAEERYINNSLTIQADCNDKIIIPTINAATALCASDIFDMHYETTGDFDPENIFTAYLIPAGESEPLHTIGNILKINSGNIACTLPAVTSGFYYIRIDASSPATEGYVSMNPIYITANTTINEYITIDAGETYTLPSGIIVNTTGVYSSSFTTAAGCDSTINSNVTIVEESCGTPAGVAVYPIGNIYARVSWDAEEGASQYQVQYRKTGTVTWLKYSVTTTYKILNGLSPSTAYQYQVRAKCGATWTALSPLATFTTTSLRTGFQNNKCIITPNPSSGIFNVQYTSETTDEIKILIYDLVGNKMYDTSKLKNDHVLFEEINITSFPKGLYMLQIQEEDKIELIKVILE
ncbi:MAG: T9SS type A sorting domain-containing protein [Fimbriimonadaceae bacterium]|nr:T9SS type A sorting domain-containing protein [Chitinophagales bacterium]